MPSLRPLLRVVPLVALGLAAHASPPPDAYARWLGENLPATLRADPAIATPDATPLADGTPNLLRAAFDLPLSASAAAEALPVVALYDDHLVLRYRQLSGGRGTPGIDYTVGGLRYVVEAGDLATGIWRRGPALLELAGPPLPLGDRAELASVRLKTPLADTDRAFLRLRVERPAPPARATDPMEEMGVASHLFRYSDYAAACDSLIASGVKWIRTGVEWGSLQPTAGELPSSANASLLARVDYVVNRLHENGVNIVWELAYGTDWCSSAPAGVTSGRRFYRPSDLAAWARFVEFMTDRYRGKIRHWEVWNEPDHSTFFRVPPGEDIVEQYLVLLAAASAKIRAADASNRVLLGGLAGFDGSRESYGLGTFFDRLCERGAADHFDIVVYHVYGDSPHQLRVNRAHRDVIERHGLLSRPVWLTETGFSTAGDASLEAKKAERVHRHWQTHMRLGHIERLFWFLDRSDNVAGNASESNFGLRANNRAPLPAYYAHQALGGARVDFRTQTRFPALVATDRTIYFSGSGIEDHAPDGSSKRIPVLGHMYFHVNDAWLRDGNGGLDDTVDIEVEYLDSSTGGFRLDYDIKGPATAAQLPVVMRQNTGQWKTHVFTLADVEFANSQPGGADFRIYAGRDAPLVLRSVVVRKRDALARIKLGPVDRFHLVERENGAAGEATENPALTFQGETCRQILDGSRYIVLRVSDGFLGRGDTRVRVRVRFWDDADDEILVQYNAVDGSTAKTARIRKTATNAWRTAHVDLADADFRNASSWTSDLRLATGPDNRLEHISLVEFEPLPLLDDDFQDGDSAGWSPGGGVWSVIDEAGARAYRQGSASAAEATALAGHPTWDDYEFAATLRLLDPGAAGLVARHADADHHYALLADAAQGRLLLEKRVGGVATTLIAIPWDFSTGEPVRLRLALRGARLTAHVDELQAFTLHDTSLTAGRAGLCTRSARATFDDISIR